MADRPFYSVKQVAELLAVRQHTVLGLIRRGDLVAVDVSLAQGGKPRWRILPDDLDGFIARRTHHAAPVRSRRRKPKTNVIQYF